MVAPTLSKSGVQIVPPSTVFQAPPPAVETRIVLPDGSELSTVTPVMGPAAFCFVPPAMKTIALLTGAGPTLCHCSGVALAVPPATVVFTTAFNPALGVATNCGWLAPAKLPWNAKA